MSDEKRVLGCKAAVPCDRRPPEQVIRSTAALARSVASIIGFASRAGDHTTGQTYVVARALELAARDLGDAAGGDGVAIPGHEACVEDYVQRVRAEIVRQAAAEREEAALAEAVAGATQGPGVA